MIRFSFEVFTAGNEEIIHQSPAVKVSSDRHVDLFCFCFSNVYIRLSQAMLGADWLELCQTTSRCAPDEFNKACEGEMRSCKPRGDHEVFT